MAPHPAVFDEADRRCPVTGNCSLDCFFVLGFSGFANLQLTGAKPFFCGNALKYASINVFMNRDNLLRSHPSTSHCYPQTLLLAVSLTFFAAPAWCQHPKFAPLMLEPVETKERSKEAAVAEASIIRLPSTSFGKEPQLNRLVEPSPIESQETGSTTPRLNTQPSTAQPVLQELQHSDFTTSQSAPLPPNPPSPKSCRYRSN
jgi:hypothetical protein